MFEAISSPGGSEFLNLASKIFIGLSLLRFLIRSWHYSISLKILPVLATEPFVGSRGLDLGSEVKVSQQTPKLLALSAMTCLRRPMSHLK